ncbi:MAG TPA: hypothetical protein VKU00_28945 [Chthonomonadaceae bacterium]|nr:hypothetical protein [Chthonomonadaceae bacterium]
MARFLILMLTLLGVVAGSAQQEPHIPMGQQHTNEANASVPPIFPTFAPAASSTLEPGVNAPFNDPRAWQHGISCLKVGRQVLVVWSSWGNPPQPVPNPEANWEHDVYYARVDPQKPEIVPHTLVSLPEAQEPASAAINSRGRILMSCEDGADGLDQRAGLWDAELRPIKSYPFMIREGGHSGHVAAMDDKFLVAYSEGWTDGGGVDNLGTGNDVWARIVDNDGKPGPEIPTAVQQGRNWWPVVAASDRNWLEVWQSYPDAILHGAIIRPDGSIPTRFQITDDIRFYVYNVTYLPSLHRYAVFGTRADGGFVALVDTDGSLVSVRTGLPETVRESHLIAEDTDGKVTALYPMQAGGVAVLHITHHSVALTKTLSTSGEWETMGTDGLFLSPQRALLFALSKSGLRIVNVEGI